MNRWGARITALLLCWAGLAFGSSPDVRPAVLELIVNGAQRGEVFVLLRGDDVLVPLHSLQKAGLVRLQVPTEQHAGVAHVALRAASLPFVYDEPALSLSLTVAPSVLAQTRVDISTSAPSDLRYAYDPSLFLNYAPRLINGRDFQAFAEAGLSLGRVLVESSASYTPEAGPVRLLSKATYDDRAHLRSATLGDTFVSAGPLGGALTLGGVSFARNYALDPYLVKIPRLGFTGSTLSPSTVDVYVNDVLVRRLPVEPGEFQLINITPQSGAGSTRYVLRDAYGQEQRLESAYYSSAGVLAPGLSEFSYGLGLVRESFGTRSLDYGAPAVLARHRFGLTEHVTPGFHLEFDRSLANLGADVTLVGALGEVELHAAGSRGTEAGARPGGAGILAYSYRGRRASLGVVLRSTSRQFATLSLSRDEYRHLFEQVTSTQHSLGSSLSLATALSLALSHELQPVGRFNTSLGARLSQSLSLNIHASRGRFEYGAWEHDLFVTLGWSLPAQHSAQLGMHLSGAQPEATAVLSRSAPYPTGVGYQLSGATGAAKRAAANLRAQSSFGTLGASYTYLSGEHSTLLEAAGGVVLVGGRAYFTRPVSQSFAVLELPGVPNVRGYLNNREMGTTGESGTLFIPDLGAYRSNLIGISQVDMPIDYAFNEAEVEIAPMSRGGAVIRLAVHAVRLARGRVVHGPGRHPEPVQYGSLSVATPAGPIRSLLGKDGEFELDGLPGGRWIGQVAAGKIRCQVALDIPSAETVVQYLGTLRCTPPSPTRAAP